mmetsp:Transcript_39769/g.83619  ORF Transcript_39769/g.83619 Transcript_39769/m.83619 type:complete len:263 (-) Transcript_39769:603-1391(-)
MALSFTDVAKRDPSGENVTDVGILPPSVLPRRPLAADLGGELTVLFPLLLLIEVMDGISKSGFLGDRRSNMWILPSLAESLVEQSKYNPSGWIERLSTVEIDGHDDLLQSKLWTTASLLRSNNLVSPSDPHAARDIPDGRNSKSRTPPPLFPIALLPKQLYVVRFTARSQLQILTVLSSPPDAARAVVSLPDEGLQNLQVRTQFVWPTNEVTKLVSGRLHNLTVLSSEAVRRTDSAPLLDLEEMPENEPKSTHRTEPAWPFN